MIPGKFAVLSPFKLTQATYVTELVTSDNAGAVMEPAVNCTHRLVDSNPPRAGGWGPGWPSRTPVTLKVPFFRKPDVPRFCVLPGKRDSPKRRYSRAPSVVTSVL